MKCADRSECNASGRRQLVVAAGWHLRAVLEEIDRISALLRPYCDDATLDLIDAGSEMLVQAVKRAVEPQEEVTEGTLRAA